jgi:hypothetical protein
MLCLLLLVEQLGVHLLHGLSMLIWMHTGHECCRIRLTAGRRNHVASHLRGHPRLASGLARIVSHPRGHGMTSMDTLRHSGMECTRHRHHLYSTRRRSTSVDIDAQLPTALFHARVSSRRMVICEVDMRQRRSVATRDGERSQVRTQSRGAC